MKKPILLVKSLIVASLLAVSCDDDNDYKCPEAFTGELTETETNVTGLWKLKSIVTEEEIDLTDDDVENPTTDLFSQYTECQQDVAYEFNSDRSYSFLAGTTAADCENEQTISGTWQLNEASVLSLVASCAKQSTLIEVNETNTEFTIETTYNFVDVNDVVITSVTTSTYEKVTE
ncbi:DUF5004 domain-containing protein [Aestuariibaculum suncheonense]|uniref:DUF5004 domain-containing protein n=1 Tax=Aestuariibaculum suncheonense TaxID=1028745 RepID=A0A8J6UBD1_9FLAO|nr:DUF5004 domain-containing protein [Aestuariibaculum suncheonense]MBD0835800.1 DUF5004 domain-containing protein [Aestuariibaculum suncheonense]